MYLHGAPEQMRGMVNKNSADGAMGMVVASGAGFGWRR